MSIGIVSKLEYFPSRSLLATWAVAVLTVWVLTIFIDRLIPPARTSGTTRSPAAALSTWDGMHYAAIAFDGYSVEGRDRRRFAFFPLLPATARLLGGPTHAPLAGIVVSQICLLGCMILLNRVGGVTPQAPLRLQPGFWLLISPLSFFFLVFYTESLYLFLTLLMITAWHNERFIVASLFGCMTGLTRPTACLLPVIFLRRALGSFLEGRKTAAVLLCAAAPLLGIGFYMVYVNYSLGQPFAYLEIQKTWWGSEWKIPFVSLAQDLRSFIFGLASGRLLPVDVIVRIFSSVSILFLVTWGWRRLDPAFRAYIVISMLFIHSQEPHRSTARYELVLFPVFLLIPQFLAGFRRIAHLAIAMMVLLEVALFLRHVSFRWVA